MEQLVQQFQFELTDGPLVPRYNIAPSQKIAAVCSAGNASQRLLTMLRWGLIPSWSKDPRIGNRMINARGETVADKPSFRSTFKHRRCLILSDGYYEWQSRGRQSPKQPYLIQMRDQQPFAMAGIWETWNDPNGTSVGTCSIITTQANDLTQTVHDRMPVILEPSSYHDWLESPPENRALLEALLRPFKSSAMIMFPVSTVVNRPQNDTAACLEPVDVGPD